MDPSVGPTKGWTSVTIHGQNFVDGNPTMCRFGQMRVIAQIVSTTKVWLQNFRDP